MLAIDDVGIVGTIKVDGVTIQVPSTLVTTV
jgi:hypothetical protein